MPVLQRRLQRPAAPGLCLKLQQQRREQRQRFRKRRRRSRHGPFPRAAQPKTHFCFDFFSFFIFFLRPPHPLSAFTTKTPTTTSRYLDNETKPWRERERKEGQERKKKGPPQGLRAPFFLLSPFSLLLLSFPAAWQEADFVVIQITFSMIFCFSRKDDVGPRGSILIQKKRGERKNERFIVKQ